MYKKACVMLIVAFLFSIGYLNITGVKAKNEIDEKVKPTVDWLVELEQQQSEDPDLYQSYHITVKNIGKKTKKVKIEISQPLTEHSKIIFEPLTSEIKHDEIYKTGNFYPTNEQPQKFTVVINWEENKIKYSETFIVGK